MAEFKISDLKLQIPYKWKIQTKTKDGTKAQCVAYIDARDVMDILDKVVGPAKWQDKYEFVGDKLIAGIGIYSEALSQWIWKFDTGVEANYEKEKSQFSDAFKRAAVKWGIGRFLYDLEIKWIKLDTFGNPIDEGGKRVYDLTEYFNYAKTVNNKLNQ